MSKVFIGMETSGELRRRFQAVPGITAMSCDLLPAQDIPILNSHWTMDVFEALDYLRLIGWRPDMAVFHPTCTYLTNSAAWAFADPDYVRYPGKGYHQKPKPETLTGAARRAARDAAIADVRKIISQPIPLIVVENPIGALSSAIGKPTQIVQPYQFGDDASKATCLWVYKDGVLLPPQDWLPVDPANYVPPTPRPNGKAYWANQTDTGQNRLGPSADRWQDRSDTFPGIANALVDRMVREVNACN
jgi:hypothetical protein